MKKSFLAISLLLALTPANAFANGSSVGQGNGNVTDQKAKAGGNVTQINKTTQYNDNSRKLSPESNSSSKSISGSKSKANSNSHSNANSNSNSNAVSGSDASAVGNIGSNAGVEFNDNSISKSEYENKQYIAPDIVPVSKDGYGFSMQTPSGYSFAANCPTGGTSFNIGFYLGGFGFSDSDTDLPDDCLPYVDMMQGEYHRSKLIQSADFLGDDYMRRAHCENYVATMNKMYGTHLTVTECLFVKKDVVIQPKPGAKPLPPKPSHPPAKGDKKG